MDNLRGVLRDHFLSQPDESDGGALFVHVREELRRRIGNEPAATQIVDAVAERLLALWHDEGIGLRSATVADCHRLNRREPSAGTLTAALRPQPPERDGYRLPPFQLNVISADRHKYDHDGQYTLRVPEAQELAVEDMRAAAASGEYRLVQVFVGLPPSGKTQYLLQHFDPAVIYWEGVSFDSSLRRQLAEIAREAGLDAEILWFDPPFEVSQSRNAGRPPDRRIPDQLMSATYKRIGDEPPSEAEGFKRVVRIVE